MEMQFRNQQLYRQLTQSDIYLGEIFFRILKINPYST